METGLRKTGLQITGLRKTGLTGARLCCVLGAGVLAFGAASAAYAQPPAAPAQAGTRASEEIVREIDDPHTGARWLLLRNKQFPGGPGRLVLAADYRNAPAGAAHREAGARADVQLLPVIRAGDRLIVEQHTARMDAVLEARAVNPAALGGALGVRLTIGGRVMRAVALGPGRAAIQLEAEERP